MRLASAESVNSHWRAILELRKAQRGMIVFSLPNHFLSTTLCYLYSEFYDFFYLPITVQYKVVKIWSDQVNSEWGCRLCWVSTWCPTVYMRYLSNQLWSFFYLLQSDRHVLLVANLNYDVAWFCRSISSEATKWVGERCGWLRQSCNTATATQAWHCSVDEVLTVPRMQCT